MTSKLACVIYLSSSAGLVEAVERRLIALGFDVRSFQVTKESASLVAAGDISSLPNELQCYLEKAELCVLLLDDNADSLGPFGGLGSDMGCRVVTIGGNPDNFPAELDDIADGHITNINQPLADDVLGGNRMRIKADGTQADKRTLKRQKCQ